jgi:hypothetical protein
VDDWVKIGLRYINLANICEVHLRERPRSAKVFYVGGGHAELDEDDTLAVMAVLDARAIVPEEGHRTVIPLKTGD